MSLEYNPEADVIERIGTLEVEAAELARKRDAATSDEARQAIDRQLKRLEDQIASLKRHIGPSGSMSSAPRA